MTADRAPELPRAARGRAPRRQGDARARRQARRFRRHSHGQRRDLGDAVLCGGDDRRRDRAGQHALQVGGARVLPRAGRREGAVHGRPLPQHRFSVVPARGRARGRPRAAGRRLAAAAPCGRGRRATSRRAGRSLDDFLALGGGVSRRGARSRSPRRCGRATSCSSSSPRARPPIRRPSCSPTTTCCATPGPSASGWGSGPTTATSTAGRSSTSPAPRCRCWSRSSPAPAWPRCRPSRPAPR